jgi:hypothetical protein
VKSVHVQLDEGQYEIVRGIAFVENKRMAEVMREAIREYVANRKKEVEFNKTLTRVLEAYKPALKELAKY